MGQTYDKLDSSIHDVRIYSKGLITALERKNFSEIEEYATKMQSMLNDILKFSDVEKSQIKTVMKFR